MKIKVRSYSFLILLVIPFLISQTSYAQVINDLIQNRLELKINGQPFQSNTTNCKVERACVDESLTGKCIEYHNDQWFWFKTTQAGPYYINISGQNCRDTRGVQLVVIDGEPCQTKTYKILSCTSLASQDDVFVQLTDLQANFSYLLNIDGYLEDFCDFKIQVSTQPVGLPTQQIQNENVENSKVTEKIVEHSWAIPVAIANQITEYQVLRRPAKDKLFIPVSTISHEKNTSGFSQLTYSSTDSLLKPGIYFYKIIATAPDNAPILIKEEEIEFQPKPKIYNNPEDNLVFKLDFKAGTPISLYIFRADTETLMKKTHLLVQKKGQEIPFYIAGLRKQGIKKLIVKITNHKTKETQVSTYDI